MKRNNPDQFDLFKKNISEEEAGGIPVGENEEPSAEDLEAHDIMMAKEEGGVVSEKKAPQSPGQRQKARREGKETYEDLRRKTWETINDALIKDGKKPEPGTPVRAQKDLPLKGSE